jgi:hypothetical protein
MQGSLVVCVSTQRVCEGPAASVANVPESMPYCSTCTTVLQRLVTCTTSHRWHGCVGCCLHCRDEAVAVDVSKRTFVTGCITDWPADSPFPYAEVRKAGCPGEKGGLPTATEPSGVLCAAAFLRWWCGLGNHQGQLMAGSMWVFHPPHFPACSFVAKRLLLYMAGHANAVVGARVWKSCQTLIMTRIVLLLVSPNFIFFNPPFGCVVLCCRCVRALVLALTLRQAPRHCWHRRGWWRRTSAWR